MSEAVRAKDKESGFHWSRRHVNENLGLILTAIASFAAALAWNEARLTRRDAHEDALRSAQIQRDSLTAQVEQFRTSFQAQRDQESKAETEATRAYGLQKDSLNAQIQSLQLDQRPFIRVTSAEIEGRTENFPEKQETLGITIQLALVGKTPAINVQYFIGTKSNVDYKTLKASELRKLLATAVHHGSDLNPVINPDTNKFGIPGTLIFPRNQTFLIFGYIRYDDLFNKAHKTEFCYYGDAIEVEIAGPPGEPDHPLPCPRFIPNIT